MPIAVLNRDVSAAEEVLAGRFDSLQKHFALALAAERERCAKVAAELLVSADEASLACRVVAAIREGE